MRNLANFALFQLAWFVAVGGAARGELWAGPFAVGVFLLIHLGMLPSQRSRGAELVYVLAVGAIGALADTALHAIGATAYPTSVEGWGHALVPPWIISLWVAFALLPRFSLGWLAGKPGLAFLLGAIGGPLSYLGGTRMGAVAAGENELLTWGALSLEYALITPLLLRFAPAFRSEPGTLEANAHDTARGVAPS